MRIKNKLRRNEEFSKNVTRGQTAFNRPLKMNLLGQSVNSDPYSNKISMKKKLRGTKR